MPSSQPPLNSLATRWRACKGQIPPPLVGASVTVVDGDQLEGPSTSTRSSSSGKIYLFGGRLVSTRRMVNDLYALDIATLHWEKIDLESGSASKPQPRYFHSCEVWRGKLVIFGGMGYQQISPEASVDSGTQEGSAAKGKTKSESLCVLDEVVAFDLETRQWDLDFIPPESATPSDRSPAPRYAHLSSICGDSLVIIGGQDVSNQYVDQINVLNLAERRWTGATTFQRQCGSYRSLAVASPWNVEAGTKSSELAEILAGRRTGSTTPGAASGRPRAGTHSSSTTAGSSLVPLTPSSNGPASLSGSTSNISGLSSGPSDPDTDKGTTGTAMTTPAGTSIGPSRSIAEPKRPLTMLQPLSMSSPARNHPPGIYIYSNYNFTDVKRELEVATLRESEDGDNAATTVELEDRSSQMAGVALPPGLRFPTAVVVGDHLLISGTYLANTSQTFSIWSLHLPKLVWARLDVGPLLQTGSWNRAVHWARRNQLIILGNRDRDLVADYNHRQTNWDHVLLLDLEAWGISQPPAKPMSTEAMELGLRKLEAAMASSSAATALAKQAPRLMPRRDSTFDSKTWLGSAAGSNQAPVLPSAFGSGGDFEIVCADGVRLGCDRAVLEARWPWFRAKLARYQRQAKAAAELVMARRPTDGDGDAAGSEGAQRHARNMNSIVARYSAAVDDASTNPPSPAHSRTGSNGTALFGRPVADSCLTPRQLHLSEASPVVMALLQFFYTRCFCTPLQRHPSVVASLLVLSQLYNMEDTLGVWARHAASVLLSEDLLPDGIASNHLGAGTPGAGSPTASTPGTLPGGKGSFGPARPRATLPPEECHRLAVILYEAAGLAGCEPLQLRALRTVVLLSKHIQRMHLADNFSPSTSAARRPAEMSRNATSSNVSSAYGTNDGSVSSASTSASPVTLRAPRPTSVATSTSTMPHSPVSPSADSYDGNASVGGGSSKAEKLLGIGSNGGKRLPSTVEEARSGSAFRRLASSGSTASETLGGGSGAAPPVGSGFLRPEGQSTSATSPTSPPTARSNTISRKRFSIFGRVGGSASATLDNDHNGTQSDGGLSRIVSGGSHDDSPHLQPSIAAREPSPSAAPTQQSSYIAQPAAGLPPPTLSAKETKRLEKLEKKSGKKLATTVEWSESPAAAYNDGVGGGTSTGGSSGGTTVSGNGGGGGGGGGGGVAQRFTPKLASSSSAGAAQPSAFFSY